MTHHAHRLHPRTALLLLAASLAAPLHAAIKAEPAPKTTPSAAATAPNVTAAAPAAPLPQGLELKDIAPPIDVLPYPPWMVASALCAVLLLTALLAWWLIRRIRNRPPPLPESAIAIALRALESLAPTVDHQAPYAFSIAVSDVLRRFIETHYRLQALHQTSFEFLESLSHSSRFDQGDQTLLAQFLEKCDLIKFARIDASRDDSAQLLSAARAFVQAARP